MSIPLRGQREVFRRLEEQQEARRIRQFEQQEMLGLEPEHPDIDFDFNFPSYRQLGANMRGFAPGQLVDIRREMDMFFRGGGIGFNSYGIANLGTRRSAQIYSSPARNIRGISAQSMWIDEYVGRPNTPDTRESIANMLRDSMDHWYQRALVDRMMRDRPHLFANRNGNVYSSNPYAEIMMPYHEPFLTISDYVAGGRVWSWDRRDWITQAYICRRTKKVIFGSVRDYMKELMQTQIDNFLGITKQERMARELTKRNAGNKSFATLLLKRREE